MLGSDKVKLFPRGSPAPEAQPLPAPPITQLGGVVGQHPIVPSPGQRVHTYPHQASEITLAISSLVKSGDLARVAPTQNAVSRYKSKGVTLLLWESGDQSTEAVSASYRA